MIFCWYNYLIHTKELHFTENNKIQKQTKPYIMMSVFLQEPKKVVYAW